MHPDQDPDQPASGEELPPLRRSFPVPKRRESPTYPEEDCVSGKLFSDWMVKGAVGIAVVLATAAVCVKLAKTPVPEAAKASAEPAPAGEKPVVPHGPEDIAKEIYVAAPPVAEQPLLPPPVPEAVEEEAVAPGGLLPPGPSTDSVAMVETPVEGGGSPAKEGEGVFDMLDAPMQDTPPETVAEAPTDTPPEPIPPVEKRRCLSFSEIWSRSIWRPFSVSRHRLPMSKSQIWAGEITRIQTGQALPASAEGLPEALGKLQSIYRREKERAVSPAASPDTRQLDFYVYANGEVKLLHNGSGVTWTSSNAGVYRASLPLKPGDVVGFELPSNRELAVIARAGVMTMFSSSERWEAVENPTAEFWTGAKSAARTRVYREKSGYKARMNYYEKVANAHSADYAIIWGQGAANVGFRYVVRKVDLPEKK